jgi:hypothetical protein
LLGPDRTANTPLLNREGSIAGLDVQEGNLLDPGVLGQSIEGHVIDGFKESPAIVGLVRKPLSPEDQLFQNEPERHGFGGGFGALGGGDLPPGEKSAILLELQSAFLKLLFFDCPEVPGRFGQLAQAIEDESAGEPELRATTWALGREKSLTQFLDDLFDMHGFSLVVVWLAALERCKRSISTATQE